MPKVNWEETCSKCIYGSTQTRIGDSKGRCSHKTPTVKFVEDVGWVCESFIRRWDTQEDLEQSKVDITLQKVGK